MNSPDRNINDFAVNMTPEPTTRVAGWTCLRFIPASTPDDNTPEDAERANKADDQDEVEVEDEQEITTGSDTTTSICEWEDCEQVFTGPNAPTLLYQHIVDQHIGKAGATQTYDPKCRWGIRQYEGKIRRFLLSHMITHVPDYRPLACENCSMTFQRESGLRSHHKTCKAE